MTDRVTEYLARGDGSYTGPKTSAVTRAALAKLAYNSAVQYIKLIVGGGTRTPFEELPTNHRIELVQEVLRIEADLTGRDDAVVRVMDKTDGGTLLAMACLDGPCAIYRGIARAGVIDQLELQPVVKPGRGRPATRDDVISGFEDLDTAAIMDFATPAEIAVSPAAWALLMEPTGMERITLSGSPQAAETTAEELVQALDRLCDDDDRACCPEGIHGGES